MTRRRQAAPRTFACPHCGAEVKVGAAVCRECGSDAETGWQDEEEVRYQSLDLPTGYAQDPEHPGGAVSERRPPWIVITAVIAVLALAAWALLRF